MSLIVYKLPFPKEMPRDFVEESLKTNENSALSQQWQPAYRMF